MGDDTGLDARGGAIALGYAAIYIAEFPTLARLRLDGNMRSGAVAIVEGKAPLEKIVSFNRAAKDLCLEHGMSKVQADTSGQIAFHARSPAEERTAFNAVFALAERFSPRVQIVASPINRYGGAFQLAAQLLLDQTGMEMVFGDAASFAAKLRAELKREDYPANVAVAPNAEASLLLARSYAGATHVYEQGIASKLAPLPVTALRAEAAVLATLKRWGIRNLGELAALPETALISRLGQQGRRLQRLARGVEDHLLVPEEPSFVLSDHVALDSPLESLESLLFILSPMLERLLKQAVDHAYALRSVTLTLELEKRDPHGLEVRPAIPVQSRDLLLKLLNLKLQAQPPQAGILGVTLTAEPAVPQVSQRGLFQAQFPEPDKLDLLLARLKSMAGEENVGSPFLTNSNRDDEFLMGAFRPSPSAAENSTTKPVRSALRRFRPLQPAKVTLSQALPSQLFWRGERLEFVDVTGPWQSSGYWWDGRRWEADEWDAIVSRPPQALRLRHERQSNAWFVAGRYD